MRNKLSVLRSLVASVALLVLFCAVLPAQEGLELASTVPPDPLVYLEVRDFGGGLQKLLESDFAEALPNTRAFKDFTKTKLFNKLADRINELQEVTGFGLTVDRAREVAGERAAFALYDIGELRFVFVTRISSELLADTALWRMRERFEERRLGELTYFVKEDPNGRVSLMFTSVDDTLVVGTDFNRFEECLALLEGGGESLASSDRFKAAFPEDFDFEDAALFLDQERIAATPYFRAYWVFGNQADLTGIKRVVISLRFGDDGISESRWLTTDNSSQDQPIENAADLAGVIPHGADFYLYADARRDDDFGGSVANELFEDSDEEIDEGLNKAFAHAQPQAYCLAIGASYDDDRFFLTVTKTLVIRLESPDALNRQELERALAGVFERKLLHPGQGEFTFADRGGLRIPVVPLFKDSLPAYTLRGNLLLISNDAAYLESALEAGPDTAQEEFVKRFKNPLQLFHMNAAAARENLTAYLKVVAQRDNWRSSSNAVFFWRNVVSLLNSLEFVDAIEFSRGSEGQFVVEKVSYLFKR